MKLFLDMLSKRDLETFEKKCQVALWFRNLEVTCGWRF